MKINTNKSVCPDAIPNWVLHDLFGIISAPVCVIFNSSIREGFIPTLWKSTDVVSLIKTPQLKDITKALRPIALIANLMKILESIAGDWLWAIVKPHIKLDQYAAVRGSSTCHALVDIIHHWYKAAEKFQTSRVLLLDYSKAFNLIDHNIIIAKLAAYRVLDIFLRWIGSFLGDRHQRVCIGEHVSDWSHLSGSVPQGSGLRPFPYVAMINNMSADGFMCHKFMDDSTLTEACDDPLESTMLDAADQVTDWSKENHTKLNGTKTKEMVITFAKDTLIFP